MSKDYNPKEIEGKWQKEWEENNAFIADENSKKEKLYVLDMFPYPSGAGIHMGHTENFTATDIYSRFKRMHGYEVLHPMGWDAFGLPAENYAIKTGVPPAETTDAAINNFRKQLKSLGTSYDWSREFGTHNPKYYKWTQWFFLFLYKNGLAEKRMAKVNWCPKDQTVLANEQTISESGEKGVCVRCGTKVVQKDLEQWFFKITDFADALIDDLEQVDWPESTKLNQRNWIGRSEGAEIDFDLAGLTEKIRIFTTRPDTLFGATYIVLSPEHSLIKTLTDKSDNKEDIFRYIEIAKNKTDLERQENKEKTGIEIRGIKAINPVNKEEIPIFIADYVLGGYGTGAIMAVPAHDERDYEFAKKHDLPIKPVIEPALVQTTDSSTFRPNEPVQDSYGVIAIVKHWQEDKYLGLTWAHAPGWFTMLSGGIEEGQTAEETVLKEIHEETGYKNVRIVKDLGVIHSKYYHVPKKLNRSGHANVFVVELENDEQGEISSQEASKHSLQWLSAQELAKLLTAFSHRTALAMHLTGVYTGEGILINSDGFNNLTTEEARKKITEKFGKPKTTYKLRDWLISRQRYWGAPIPVVYDPEGKAHPVPEEYLPWQLPTDVEFKPTGLSPLGQSKELFARTEKIFGKGWKPEIDTMDTFVCSSWYYYRFTDPSNNQEFASREQIKKWMPVDLYMGGAEHTVLHLMYARFLTKALKKFGHIDCDEPFLKLRHQGLILAEDGNRMSKSKGNVVNPDDVVENFGADALRLHIMFLGPLEATKPWSIRNIAGVIRFLEKVWRLKGKVDVNSKGSSSASFHQALKKVSEDIETMRFNTAVSAMMIYTNELEKCEKISQEEFESLLLMLAPFAPHMTEELWHELGHSDSIHTEPWPKHDESKLQKSEATIVIQVDGRVRGKLIASADMTEAEAISISEKLPEIQKWLAGKTIKSRVYVPGKVLNYITS